VLYVFTMLFAVALEATRRLPAPEA
jgi:hypothetical protein